MDDDDLYIVMRQHLKFFRIDVQLNTDRLGKPCAVASQSPTPSRLPSVQPPSEGFNVVAADSSKQPVASSGNPCTTIDVFDPDPLRDGVLRVERFRSTLFKDPMAKLVTLKQLGSMEHYHDLFETFAEDVVRTTIERPMQKE
ncbi:protein NBR1-like protein [Gossypium australe]|uniref:Protein NBR1-like protein n=1 Tax=Gossypium australe TaxID=47621 RepID=A0A5B6V598_9ROSI|nr:protein NBR1-like protein [Gossypium australe]